jgi:Mg2+ and Co2+ transporter CorA
VALKESTAVERLTRTTILLAKVTILFLPVSLMTGYFSVQVKGIENQYSPKVYWLSFLVVALLSIGLVLAFELASYKVAGRTVYKSLTRTLWDKGKRKTC